MVSEYCPKCGELLMPTPEPDRLCDTCGWFGDQGETLREPPDGFMLTAAISKALDLYRFVCRKELEAEAVAARHPGQEVNVRKVHAGAAQAKQSLLEMFVAVRKPLQRVLKRVNGMVPWPTEWTTNLHYNASHDPCDMIVGPCSCGAWHNETEEWVRECLKRHNATIEPQA
jgi:hypothetical protein